MTDKCNGCGSIRILSIDARSKDMNHYDWRNADGSESNYEGYPTFGFCNGGDNVYVVICLDCGKVQNQDFPLSLDEFFELDEPPAEEDE